MKRENNNIYQKKVVALATRILPKFKKKKKFEKGIDKFAKYMVL